MLMKSLLGAAAVLALSTGLVAAAPAEVERTGNVRAGPGTGHPVVATLPAGSMVDVGSCTGSWCAVAFEGGEGYMARSLLALGAAPPAVAVAPAPYYDDYYDDDPYYGYAYGPSIGFVHRHRHWRHRHGHHGHWGHHGPGRPGWGGRPPVGGNPGGGAPKIGQSVRPGGGFARGGGSIGGGGAKVGGSFGGGGGAAVSAPRASAPASSGSGGVNKLR